MKMEPKKRALDKIYRRRDRYEIPEWQRDEVWPIDRKQLLIDSILLGWKLPKFYFSKVSESPEEFEVVDGQQRLMTIFEFFDGNLSLSSRSSRKFGGSHYQDLPDKVVDDFDDYEIEFDEITDSSEKELKEFFKRLQGGLPLTASEKLNAVHSNMTEFARKLSRHPFFMEKVWIRDTRYAYFDIVSKVAAIAVDGINTGLRYDDLEATFVSNAKFSPKSNVGRVLSKSFDFLNQVFPTRNKALRNRSTIQSFSTFAFRLVSQGNETGYEKKLLAFFEHFEKELSIQVELGQQATDSDYLEFQRTLSANVKSGANTRHEILLRKSLLFDADFIDVLGPESIIESGIKKDIQRLGSQIGLLVETINEGYSAVQGSDLFKATNKTASALRRLGKSISDYDSYTRFIDDIYFLFHEGAGQRLAGAKPASFVDVNDLRTSLQHDVEHGRRSTIAAKKKKLGKAFLKYGGEGSPMGLAPDRFPVVQANILVAIESDLRQLLGSNFSKLNTA